LLPTVAVGRGSTLDVGLALDACTDEPRQSIDPLEPAFRFIEQHSVSYLSVAHQLIIHHLLTHALIATY
jgi:hypothetical protein